ncbi:hypothetical protein [Helicobacter pylori]|uniref:hypothetical protein n=1 Tax=Helicobacter pylori TaxID=210 RepID=UPI0013F46D60|nr:hypothetical protein [Helicobacter pylori]MBM0603853.1 hypothetical protein [Helicobacter pylori]MBM0613827.1 hypothetical protein [Helicobacter pylori]MBM0616233.1 hypothetical protein [Helicobacter pylori]MBM0624304.1 hypothetical protein [Helicobacter pylori]MBM0629126.1 hypothetical protein [Helicobacter pylori]
MKTRTPRTNLFNDHFLMTIKGFYRTHSLPFLDWYFKGLSSFQTLKKGFTPLQRL